MSLLEGNAARISATASRPPAEAPIATTGNDNCDALADGRQSAFCLMLRVTEEYKPPPTPAKGCPTDERHMRPDDSRWAACQLYSAPQGIRYFTKRPLEPRLDIPATGLSRCRATAHELITRVVRQSTASGRKTCRRWRQALGVAAAKYTSSRGHYVLFKSESRLLRFYARLVRDPIEPRVLLSGRRPHPTMKLLDSLSKKNCREIILLEQPGLFRANLFRG